MKTAFLLVLLALRFDLQAEENFARVIYPESSTVPGAGADKSASDFSGIILEPLPYAQKRTIIARFIERSSLEACGIRRLETATPLVQIAPAFPPDLVKASIGERVEGILIVSKDGSVEEVYVGGFINPLLAKIAALALRQWKFAPSDHESFAEVRMPITLGEGIADSSYSEVCHEPELRSELLNRLQKDQGIRSELIQKGYASPDPSLDAKMSAIDGDNTQRIKAIVAQYGWPGPELVGTDGTNAAFILVQHGDLALQEAMLPLVQKAFEAKQLSGDAYALLTDRVLVRQGKPQVYGTQAQSINEWHGHVPVLAPIQDEKNVDKRRAEIGLPPISSYIETLKSTYFPRG